MKQQQRVYLPGISSAAWEHPTDKAALAALKKVPGLDVVLQKFVGLTTEKSLRLITLASAVRVSERQFPKLHLLRKEACAVLDSPYIPELYVSQSPFLNAGALGVDRPFIVLNSAAVDMMGDEELLSLIGHELGHCLSGHVLYKTLLYLLIRIPIASLNIPLSGAVILAIVMALKEWERKGELSADRAGLLAVQDPDVSYNLLVKLAGAKDMSQIDMNEFFLQAAEYERSGDLLDSVYKLFNLLGQSHPFPVLRLTELKSWVDRGDYGAILRGEYIRREAVQQEKVGDHFKAAASEYKTRFSSSSDPIENIAATVMDSAATAAGKAKDVFDNFFKKDKP